MINFSFNKYQMKPQLKTYLNKLAIGVSIIILTACANTTKKMVVSPQISELKSNIYALKAAQVNVMDLRPNTHIVAVHREDEAIELISAHDHLDTIINTLFKQSLINNGLSVNDHSANNIELIINSAEVHVYQKLMKYKTSSQLTLTAKVTSGEQTLTKTFNNKGKSNGVLSADLAVLERNFNQQISDALALIVNDTEIKQFLK